MPCIFCIGMFPFCLFCQWGFCVSWSWLAVGVGCLLRCLHMPCIFCIGMFPFCLFCQWGFCVSAFQQQLLLHKCFVNGLRFCWVTRRLIQKRAQQSRLWGSHIFHGSSHLSHGSAATVCRERASTGLQPINSQVHMLITNIEKVSWRQDLQVRESRGWKASK